MTATAKTARPMVFVVDDDPSVRDAIERLLGTVGLPVKSFGSPFEFLARNRPEIPSCLVLDVRLPGISGIDFQRELNKANIRIPIIFITAHGDVPMSVKAMKAGAVEFLIKPFHDQDLLDAVQTALEKDRVQRLREAEIGELRQRLRTLTARETEVLPLLISGLLNKQIAAEINASEATVKVAAGKFTLAVRATDHYNLPVVQQARSVKSPRGSHTGYWCKSLRQNLDVEILSRRNLPNRVYCLD